MFGRVNELYFYFNSVSKVKENIFFKKSLIGFLMFLELKKYSDCVFLDCVG